LVAAALGLFSAAAQAIPLTPATDNNGIVVPGVFASETVVAGTGDLAGFEIHRFFFAFHPTASPIGTANASGLQSINATFTSNQNMKFYTANLFPPNTGGLDVDVYAQNDLDTTYRTGTDQATSSIGTFIAIHDSSFTEAFSPQGLRVNGAPLSTTANQSSAVNSPTTVFGATKSLRVEGFVQNPATPLPPGSDGFGSDTSAKTSNAGTIGAGALFAIVVVPTGATVDFTGAAAGDKGPTVNFAVPEPTALGFIGLAGVTLLARRRKQA
jgi:hypothetical protein